MVQGIDHFLMRKIDNSVNERAVLWRRDFSSPEAYEKSNGPNRERLRIAIGAVDPRVHFTALEYLSSTAVSALVREAAAYRVYAVRWPVFEDVEGEGLYLQPKREIRGRVIAVADADQTPEMIAGLAEGSPPESQFAAALARMGCEVLVPVLIDRNDKWSGNTSLHRVTNQPHREWIYRQAYEMGRHIIGYEVEKILAAVDWFAEQPGSGRERSSQHVPIGVVGYGEGGLLAFYSAALDPRIDAVLVSGYFCSRQRVWEEPIYRNVFGLLEEFGDAEIATLIAPRRVVIEYSPVPQVDGPPKAREGRSGAAPGKLRTPPLEEVQAELKRTLSFFPASFATHFELIHGGDGATVMPGSGEAISAFLKSLGLSETRRNGGSEGGISNEAPNVDTADRQRRQVEELVNHTQQLMRLSERTRDEFFWKQIQSTGTNDWPSATKELRDNFWGEVIGRFPKGNIAANPRSRKILERQKWAGYEVMLDVWPDVFAWGILLVPKDLQPGDRRPVVVCQHGLEGVPMDTVTDDPKSGGYGYYKAFAARLAERGFVTFAPHNPYRGGDSFRVLQRKANPLKKSLFSIILAQHDRILDWLSEQPFVDSQRIGFYGLSYGGKTAMRVPSLLERYCLSICSADFNDWIRKNVTVDSPYSYMFSGEYEMFEFNLGNTFNYSEMAALIAPRPFMVERGHNDGVAPDEWVAYEFAKVRRLYDRLGIGERTDLEIFNGPHTINGIGTFRFLGKQLNWPVE